MSVIPALASCCCATAAPSAVLGAELRMVLTSGLNIDTALATASPVDTTPVTDVEVPAPAIIPKIALAVTLPTESRLGSSFTSSVSRYT